MNLDEYSYYRSRAFQEEEAARGAACDAARERHLQLAEAYRDRSLLILAGGPAGCGRDLQTQRGVRP